MNSGNFASVAPLYILIAIETHIPSLEAGTVTPALGQYYYCSNNQDGNK